MSATCGSSLTEQILEMKPDSLSAILKERLLMKWHTGIFDILPLCSLTNLRSDACSNRISAIANLKDRRVDDKLWHTVYSVSKLSMENAVFSLEPLYV